MEGQKSQKYLHQELDAHLWGGRGVENGLGKHGVLFGHDLTNKSQVRVNVKANLMASKLQYTGGAQKG